MPEQILTDEQAAQLGRLVDVFPEARELGHRFAEAGHDLYLVGGTVRDTLLAGGDPDALGDVDLDFTTSARPEETEKVIREWTSTVWLTGAAFGTVSAEKGGREIEITTFRADTYTPESRHPEVEYGDTIEGDLARRDFTVNALAVKVPDFAFIDCFGGLSDLQRRILRTPIDPHQSFADDPLRMVRLARFAATIDGRPDPDTLDAAGEMAERLQTISVERIRDELCKLLLGDHPDVGLDLLIDAGLADQFFPELRTLADCVDPQHRHKDVWRHTQAVMDNVAQLERAGVLGDDRREPDLILRLAALFHDIAKPETRRIHRDGTVTFHHHDEAGARVTKARMQALRFDKATTKAVTELVRLHLRFHTYRQGWTDAAVRRYVRDAGELLERLNALTRADVTTRNERKAARINARLDELEERIVELREQEELEQMRPPIDGNQIMAHLGISPSRTVGEAWNYLLERRIEEGPMSEDDALAALDAWWAERNEDPADGEE